MIIDRERLILRCAAEQLDPARIRAETHRRKPRRDRGVARAAAPGGGTTRDRREARRVDPAARQRVEDTPP